MVQQVLKRYFNRENIYIKWGGKITYRTTLDLKLNNFIKSIDKPLALLHIKDEKLL